jgi:hypothetical protein
LSSEAPNIGQDGGEDKEEGSSFSEEKEAKRLLFVGASEAPVAARTANDQKFFASFFQERSPSLPYPFCAS